MGKNPYRDVIDIEPIKQRIEVVQRPQPGAPTSAKAVVVDQKQGVVGVFDKAKSYYHTLILAITAILAGISQFSPLLDFLPDDSKKFITGGIVFLGGLLNFLKSNEIWVQKLPS